jgi:hypothetical protein
MHVTNVVFLQCKDRSMDMRIKLTLKINISILLVTTLFLGSGCQVIDNKILSGNNDEAMNNKMVLLAPHLREPIHTTTISLTSPPLWDSSELLKSVQTQHNQSAILARQKDATITPVEVKHLRPKSPTSHTSNTTSGADLNAMALKSIQIAEDRAKSIKVVSTQVIPMTPSSMPVKPLSPAHQDSSWPDLSTIATNSMQIAEDKADSNQTAALRHQAELQHMVEQHFRQ